jgi:hypothetical protein
MITCNTCNKKIDSMVRMGDHLSETGHERYTAQDGREVPRHINTYLMDGGKWCTDCGQTFTNNYRFYEHLIVSNHGSSGIAAHAKSQKIELDNLEQEWFYDRPNIPYMRQPRYGHDGNLLVKCPECNSEYKSGYFMDIDFDTWKPNTQSWNMVCSVCGVKSSTPNQNIRLRQKAYEERIVQLEEKLKRYREKYGESEE